MKKRKQDTLETLSDSQRGAPYMRFLCHKLHVILSTDEQSVLWWNGVMFHHAEVSGMSVIINSVTTIKF